MRRRYRRKRHPRQELDTSTSVRPRVALRRRRPLQLDERIGGRANLPRKDRDRCRGHIVAHDRAAVIATAVLQIVSTAVKDERQQAVESYLRDELVDTVRQARTDLCVSD